MRRIGFIALVLMSLNLFAQEGNCEYKAPKKTRKKYEAASANYVKDKVEGVELLKEVNDLDPQMPEPYYFWAKH